jgi:hypothetical protein
MKNAQSRGIGIPCSLILSDCLLIPDSRHAVGIKSGVVAHDRYIQTERLGNQEPVEGISMVPWQKTRSNRLPAYAWIIPD